MGWTLIEILMVLSIIAILIGITLGVSTGVRQRAAVGKAKVELAAIASALERYRVQYGDYPRTGVPTPFAPKTASEGGAPLLTTLVESKLLNALCGILNPKLDSIKVVDDEGTNKPGRILLDSSRFTFESYVSRGNPLLPTVYSTEVPNAILDPWGRRYQYAYMPKAGASDWYPSFVLFSAGPDGVVGVIVDNKGRPTVGSGADDLLAGT